MAKKEIAKNNVVLENLDVVYINVNDIKPNAYNPNRQSEHEFELLCRSIEEDGFTTPALVRKQDMVIVDGEHRWRAAQSVGFTEIPCVLVEMTDEQMKIATLRHNRARGEEDAELAAAVLRDLVKMGALDEAQDSLMLDDVEMSKLLNEINDPQLLANEEFNEQFEILKDSNGNSVDRSQVFVGSEAASDAVRKQEELIKKAKSQEEMATLKREAMNIFRFNFSFYGDEAKIVSKVLGPSAAERLLAICRLEAEAHG